MIKVYEALEDTEKAGKDAPEQVVIALDMSRKNLLHALLKNSVNVIEPKAN